MKAIMTEPNPTAPWYKQRWLLFVLSVPCASVILSSIMVYVAVTGRDSLVNDNYYKYGLEINQTIGQDKLAKKLGVSANVTISENGDVVLLLESLAKQPEPFLNLKLVHPTLGNRDIEVRLLPGETGYVAQVEPNLTGRWYIDLYAHDDSWRLRQEAWMPVSQLVIKP